MTASQDTSKREIRERGSGCLIPPRPGITSFWTAQCYDKNGRLVRRSTKVRGELKTGCHPKNEESWTNVTAARLFLKKLMRDTDAGTIKVGSDPSQLRYGALRQLYLNDYREQERKSLMTNAQTDEDYVCGLKHLDAFFGYDESADGKAEDKGMKVDQIPSRIAAFKAERQTAGAANGTINRSLAALRRMFSLALDEDKLQAAPKIKMLPEPKQPRQGFLGVIEYQNLYNALGMEIKNQATGKVTKPYAYIQPLLQTGYYTGMRLSEILNLRWSNVDLAGEFIHLFAGETKNDEARDIPMIDGLPKMFEASRRANPNAGENDLVFLNAEGKPIRSFIKAWRNACIKAAIPTKLNGQVVVSHFDGGKYKGFLFHDLRRTFVSNMVEAGVDPLDARSISGHKTDSVFERYNIKSQRRAKKAGEKLTESLRQKQSEAKSPRANLRVVEQTG